MGLVGSEMCIRDRSKMVTENGVVLKEFSDEIYESFAEAAAEILSLIHV